MMTMTTTRCSFEPHALWLADTRTTMHPALTRHPCDCAWQGSKAQKDQLKAAKAAEAAMAAKIAGGKKK